MTPEQMILTFRICGNHPKYKDFTCKDCPWIQNCDHDGGGAELSLRAADIIEKLMSENKELRRDSEALAAAMDIGTVAMEQKEQAK